MATEALSLAGINALYGDSHVLHDVSFSFNAGRVLALLGRNGAGKTTCMSAIIGFLPPRDGEIRLFGEPIGRLAPEAIARKYRILDEHCADVGRDPGEIERSTLQTVDIAPIGGRGAESAQEVIDRFGELADAGAEHIIFSVRDVHDPARLEIIARDVLPALRAL